MRLQEISGSPRWRKGIRCANISPFYTFCVRSQGGLRENRSIIGIRLKRKSQTPEVYERSILDKRCPLQLSPF
jgi:hypothetical protein